MLQVDNISVTVVAEDHMLEGGREGETPICEVCWSFKTGGKRTVQHEDMHRHTHNAHTHTRAHTPVLCSKKPNQVPWPHYYKQKRPTVWTKTEHRKRSTTHIWFEKEEATMSFLGNELQNLRREKRKHLWSGVSVCVLDGWLSECVCVCIQCVRLHGVHGCSVSLSTCGSVIPCDCGSL